MVLDRLADWGTYASLHPGFEEAFRFLEGAASLENGRYELSCGMYANISSVETRPADTFQFEAHQKYIDIQFLLSGHSVMTWGYTPSLSPETDYDAVSDMRFFSGEGRAVQVREGDFYILWPNDAHKPHGTDGTPDAYRVVVVKVPVR